LGGILGINTLYDDRADINRDGYITYYDLWMASTNLSTTTSLSLSSSTLAVTGSAAYPAQVIFRRQNQKSRTSRHDFITEMILSFFSFFH
jgi:hypothetical protein